MAAACGLALGLATAAPALAADEEIQVYMDEMDKPGTFGLDIHTNYVVTGDPAPDAPGGQSPLHRFRATPEFSYGLTPNFELGAYLPLATLERSGRLEAAGVKGRIKFIAPKMDGQDWWWGLNFEIGRVNHTLDINPWNAELKGIWGLRKGRWTVGMNLNLDWTVSGAQPGPATLDFDTKLAWQVKPGLQLGVESYNGLGPVRHLGHLGQETQVLYGAVDTTLGKWDLNLGVGHGYGGAVDGWVMKAVIGVPIGG